MNSTTPVTGTSAVETALVQNADTDTEASATLIKKALQSDEEMVATLLTSMSANLTSTGTKLDIMA